MSQIKTAVSMYSLQDSFARHRLDIEGVLEFVKDSGAQGVELLSDQMIAGTPHPTEDTVDRWRVALDRSGLYPVCNDIFINSTIYKNRSLRPAEQIEFLKRELDVSKQLGFNLVRLVSNTRADVTEAALRYAEQCDVRMALEIHAGMSFQSPFTAEWIQMMKRAQSEHLGLVIDMGIFCQRHPRVATAYGVSVGVTPEVARMIEELYIEHGDTARLFPPRDRFTKDNFGPEISRAFRSDLDLEFALYSTGYENTSLDVLDEYFPYIRNFHGKFYEMLDDGTEYSIDYPAILTRLNKLGYDGYIASEYEGNRFVPVDEPVDDQDQVRRHQAMLAAHIDDGK